MCGDSGSEQVPVNGCKQSVWDSPLVARIHNSLLSDSRDLVNRTRLAEVSSRESGVWLNALPVASVSVQRDSKDCSVNETWIPMCARGTTGAPWSRLSPIRRKVLTARRSERNALSRVLNTVNASNILEPSNFADSMVAVHRTVSQYSHGEGRQMPSLGTLTASNMRFSATKPGEQQPPLRTAKGQNTGT
ncbi:hypothetical protein ACOME3_010534 [Neoechinorhynchus agilis]